MDRLNLDEVIQNHAIRKLKKKPSKFPRIVKLYKTLKSPPGVLDAPWITKCNSVKMGHPPQNQVVAHTVTSQWHVRPAKQGANGPADNHCRPVGLPLWLEEVREQRQFPRVRCCQAGVLLPPPACLHLQPLYPTSRCGWESPVSLGAGTAQTGIRDGCRQSSRTLAAVSHSGGTWQ